MNEQEFYEGLYRDVQDSGVSGWYVGMSHKSLEKGFPKINAARILEVGANVGEHVKYVENDFSSYTLTDYRQTGFKSDDKRISFLVADVQNLPFSANAFDRTISTCLLHHLPDPKKALEEIRRVTTSGGLVSILVPCDPGLAYRLAKLIGPSRKWRAAGITNPDFYHYEQHRNHFPGIFSIIQEVFKLDTVQTRFWPIRLRTWNFNLYSVTQIKVTKP
jgi:SAM-dependent methyltransferase